MTTTAQKSSRADRCRRLSAWRYRLQAIPSSSRVHSAWRNCSRRYPAQGDWYRRLPAWRYRLHSICSSRKVVQRALRLAELRQSVPCGAGCRRTGRSVALPAPESWRGALFARQARAAIHVLRPPMRENVPDGAQDRPRQARQSYHRHPQEEAEG